VLRDEPFDFAGSDMTARLQVLGERINDFKEFWQPPPPGAVYFHRKLGGMYLLASRVNARVNVHQMIKQWL